MLTITPTFLGQPDFLGKASRTKMSLLRAVDTLICLKVSATLWLLTSNELYGFLLTAPAKGWELGLVNC